MSSVRDPSATSVIAAPAPPAGRERRALVVANRLPFPIDDGWKIRTFHVIRGLADHARVTLAVFHPAERAGELAAFREALGGRVETVAVPPPRRFTPTKLLLGALTPVPVHVWNQRSRAMRAAVERLCAGGRWDVVVSQLTHMWPHVAGATGTLRVVDTHNVDSVVLARYAERMRGPRRWYARATAAKLRRHEARVLRDADVVWVCSEEERATLTAALHGAPVRVVPNGVDTERLRPRPDAAVAPRRLVFFGRLDYFPNTDAVRFFAAEVLPRLRAEEPETELVVVGPGDVPDLRALAARTPGLRLTGPVPDLRPVLAEAAAVVVPLRVGGGTRLKILEAMAMGRPVVSTPLGAEGLAVRDGRDLLLADGPEALAAATLRVLRDPALAARLGAGGRAAVVGRYDWSAVAETLAGTLGWTG